MGSTLSVPTVLDHLVVTVMLGMRLLWVTLAAVTSMSALTPPGIIMWGELTLLIAIGNN